MDPCNDRDPVKQGRLCSRITEGKREPERKRERDLCHKLKCIYSKCVFKQGCQYFEDVNDENIFAIFCFSNYDGNFEIQR